MNEQNQFRCEKISRTASFVLSESVEAVFPLFGAFEERKWEPDWNPKLLYPSEERIEEGTTFTTAGRDDEGEFLWRVSKFEPDRYLIQYLVSTANRYWTITVQCAAVENDSVRTKATVTYSYWGLNEKGNQLNRIDLDRMYAEDLRDWQQAIQKYLDQ